MAVPYAYITRQVALRLSATVGVLQPAIEASYLTTPPTTGQINSPVFPFSSITDLVMLAESKFVHAVANSAHQYRANLRFLTDALATNAAMPALTATGVTQRPIVGIPGEVYDGSNSTPCVWRPLEEILARNRNSGYFKIPVYWYNINGATIHHTRSTVVVEVCGYNVTAQLTSLGSNGHILLGDDMEGAYVDEAMRQAFRDDEFAQQAAQYGSVADQWLAAFANAGRSAAA